MFLRRFNSWATASLTALLLLEVGCSRSVSSERMDAEEKATRRFWDTIHQPFVTRSEVDAIKQLKIPDTDGTHAHMVQQGFMALAQSSRGKSRQLSSLPLDDVDAAAAVFAVKKAEYLGELADLLEKIGGKTVGDSQIPGDVMMEMFKSILEHAHDREGKLWGITKDTLLAGGRASWSSVEKWRGIRERP